VVHTLRETCGWLELGCPEEAYRELEHLPRTLHTNREVLMLKCRILSAAKKWPELRRVSAASAMYYPLEPAFAEDWAWAEHKAGRTATAYALLLQATNKLQKSWRTAYFLACFAYALKRSRAASEWLTLAFLLHASPAELKERALREEDFLS